MGPASSPVRVGSGGSRFQADVLSRPAAPSPSAGDDMKLTLP